MNSGLHIHTSPALPQHFSRSGHRFGKRLRQVREKAGLSVAELARKIKLSPQAVYKWERGDGHPRRPSLDALVEILQAPELESLFGASRRGGVMLSVDAVASVGGLSDFIALSKQAIADAAGISVADVTILIEV